MSQKTTKTPVDPHHIYMLAEEYRLMAHKTSPFVVERAGAMSITGGFASGVVKYENSHFIAPLITLHAFSFELFLKCLMLLDKMTVPFTHDTKNLFNALPVSRKSRISKLYADWQKTRPPKEQIDIQRALNESSDAFEFYRYIFEAIPNAPFLKHGWLAGGVRDAVRRVILEISPQWEEPAISGTEPAM